MLGSKCSRCGMTGFKSWKAYGEHMREEEAYARRQIKTTPEEKRAIVARVEERLKNFIIDYNHETSCRCIECLNTQLDRILAGKSITWGTINA